MDLNLAPLYMFPGTVGSLWPALVIHIFISVAFGCNLDGSLSFWLPTTNQMHTLVSWFPISFAKKAFSFCGKVLKAFFWKVQTKRKIVCLCRLGTWNVHTLHKIINSTAKMLNSMADLKNSELYSQGFSGFWDVEWKWHSIYTSQSHSVLSYMFSQVSFCIYSFKVLKVRAAIRCIFPR